MLHPSFELLALVRDDFSSLGFQWRSLGCGGASGCLDALIHASSVPFCCGYLDLVTQVQPVVVMAAASSLLGLASCSSESVARAGNGARVLLVGQQGVPPGFCDRLHLIPVGFKQVCVATSLFPADSEG